ncbi:hypothetical protein [Nitrosophilus labii]|uniref:hypothetical protein n=1 Tax=Nitrosophilus labii TaxID=2706014 RepID=UPI001656C030|nr:hypothetical protein [Nitrosophilus labii]
MRKSATLIELIFTIIIIGLAMVSIPVVLSQAMKSSEFSLNQEALLAGATKIGNILTYEWDENSTTTQVIKYVLDVTDGDSELNRYPDVNSSRRIGHFKGQYRRAFDTNQTFATLLLGEEATDTTPNDIDDFNNKISTLTTISQTASDYVKDFTLKTKVVYVNDDAYYTNNSITFDFSTAQKSGSTNIKMIEVTITDNQTGEVIAVFRSYASNIGATNLLSRTF